MSICDGLEATRLIRSEWPEARIVILSIHDEDEKLFEAIRTGASGYILKNTNSADFLRGLRSALAGEAPLPAKMARRLMEKFARLSNPPAAVEDRTQILDLTPCEREVLQQIADGASDKEIAQALSLSWHTVKTHVRNPQQGACGKPPGSGPAGGREGMD